MAMTLTILFLTLLCLNKAGKAHPLDPLSPQEISNTVQIIKNNSSPSNIPWMYIWITLNEPKKQVLYPFFLSNTDPPAETIPRESLSILIYPENGSVFEVVVDLGKKRVESWNKVAKNLQPMFAYDELDAVSKMLLEDETIQKRLFKYQCTNMSLVVPDVWKYGHDGDKPEYRGRRMAQAYFYVREFQYDNYYAHPLGFLAVIDVLQKQVIELEELPIHPSEFTAENRKGDNIPTPKNSNYDPSLLPKNFYGPSLNPVKIEQPLGPSFSMVGNHLTWRKFGMRIGFNGREGVIIHNVNYNDSGNIRPLIYRAALSEIFVPYGDPRVPFHRKMPFDAGEYGVGFNVNEIDSPEICKGSVVYLNSTINTISGHAKEMKNTICIYEEDAGILWRKKDYITGRAFTQRMQRLVVSFITTLSNYDYELKWMFYPDASIRFETMLTGIVDTNLMVTSGKAPETHGSIVGDNVVAQFHQHFFVIRMDVDFDGWNNTVATVDVKPDIVSKSYGNGFHTEETVLKYTGQARTMSSATTSRTWKISSNLRNLISQSTMAWKLIPENDQGPLLSRESEMHTKSAFADYSVWVTPFQEGQVYAGGFYLNSSGLPEWVEENKLANVENTDIVLWHVLGVTHIPSIEHFPVMSSDGILAEAIKFLYNESRIGFDAALKYAFQQPVFAFNVAVRRV